jgi:hypothetical protein
MIKKFHKIYENCKIVLFRISLSLVFKQYLRDVHDVMVEIAINKIKRNSGIILRQITLIKVPNCIRYRLKLMFPEELNRTCARYPLQMLHVYPAIQFVRVHRIIDLFIVIVTDCIRRSIVAREISKMILLQFPQINLGQIALICRGD